MSNISKFRSAEDIRTDEASRWVAMLDKGLSSEEERALKQWLAESPENHHEFLETARFWDRMDTLSRLADIFPEPEQQSSAYRGSAWKAAASVLIVVGLSMFWYGKAYMPTEEGAQQIASEIISKYQTDIGQQSSFDLPDGTKLVLNTNSLVMIEYSNQNRLLKLEKGEIHVDVAHDPSRPLSVMVGGRIVQAVGTKFNIEIKDSQEIELMVTEGVVIVGVLEDTGDDQRVDEKPLLLKAESTLVAAGQEVVIDQEQHVANAEDIEPEAIAVKLSWREGNLIFRGESLEEVVAEVGRYTTVEFVFLDEKSKKIRLVGLFRAGDVDGLLYALRENFNIAYEWQGEDKILLNGL